MLQGRPAEPGMSIDEVDTPALIVDLDALEANLDHMAALAAAAGAKVRPHAKTHKSPVIAHMQMARGRNRPIRAEGRRGRNPRLGWRYRHPGQQRGRQPA